MATRNLLYKREYKINDYISIIVPTVGEILDNEDAYYNLVTIITAMPIDFMVQLEDAHIDFTSINAYELFLLMFEGLRHEDTRLIFGDLNLSDFVLEESEQNGNFILVNHKTGAKIDRVIHAYIANTLRKIHHLEKNNRKPGNEEAKKYMLKRAREKLKRKKNRETESQLESLIIAMVGTEQYKYNFEGTRELSIYQFNECARQIIKKVDYNNRMFGVYSGTINPKDLSQDDLNWLTHK